MAEHRDAYVSTLITFEDESTTSYSTKSTSSRGSVYEDEGFHLEMKLDDDANNGQTSFYTMGVLSNSYSGAYAYLLINSSHDYECYTDALGLRKSQSNIPEEIVENIVFSRQDEQTLSHPPSTPVQYKWLGRVPLNDKGSKITPTFDNMKVKLSYPATGILQCSYTTKWDQWEVRQVEVAEIVVTSYIPNSNAIAYLTINFELDPGAGTPGPEAYELQVLDYCTDDPIEGVAVTFDGTLIGTTDSDGIIFLGPLYNGEYPLVMTRTGYIPSATDTLHNDSVVIEDEEESSSSSSV